MYNAITNLPHDVFILINYRSEMFRAQLSAIFRELANLSTCGADVRGILNISVQPQLILNIKILQIRIWLIIIKITLIRHRSNLFQHIQWDICGTNRKKAKTKMYWAQTIHQGPTIATLHIPRILVTTNNLEPFKMMWTAGRPVTWGLMAVLLYTNSLARKFVNWEQNLS
jgi:hypothetical protein